MGDSSVSLNKVKEVLTNLVKEQLIDTNNFDVTNIHQMLGNFPGAAMEQALAASTKEAYNKTVDILNRTTKATDTTSDSTNAANTAYNKEIEENVTVFLQLMEGDSWEDINNVVNQEGQFGSARSTKNSLNAFEAVLAMTFGGVNGTPLQIGEAGHVASNQERRETEQGWGSIKRDGKAEDAAAGTQLPINSHEARAMWLMAAWAKHGMGLQVFGQGHHQITVRQVRTNDVNLCCEIYCGKVGLQERVRTYDLWANTENGKNHFVSTLGDLIATSITVNGKSAGKLLGGEEAMSVDIIKSALMEGDSFTMVQLGATLRVASTVKAEMTVKELDSAWDMGYNTLSHLGIEFTGTHDSTLTDQTEQLIKQQYNQGVEAQRLIGTNLKVRQDSSPGVAIETPQIWNVLQSKYRELFLKTALLQADNLDVHPECLGTALNIAQLRADNKGFKVDNTTANKETGSSVYQALGPALDLINDVRGYVGKEKFAAYHVPESLRSSLGLSYFADSDNTGRDQNASLLKELGETNVYTVVQAGSSNTQKTLFEHLVYHPYASQFSVDVNGSLENSLTSSDLIPNSEFGKNSRDEIQTIVAKIVLANFASSPATFTSSQLAKSIEHMKESATGLNPISGQVQANLYSAFGSSGSTDTTWGALFSGEQIPNLRALNVGFQTELSLAFFFMYAKLTSTQQTAVINSEEGRKVIAQQVSSLLKFTAKTLTSVSKVELRSGLASSTVYRQAGIASQTLANIFAASGDFRNQVVISADNSKVRAEIIDAINKNVLATSSNQEAELCRLKLLNGEAIKATKIQDIANYMDNSDDIKDYSGVSALDIGDASVVNTAANSITGTYGRYFSNNAFIKAAFTAGAKASGFYDDNGPQPEDATRNDTLVTNLNAVLEGSSKEQQKEFFTIVADVAGQTGADNTETSYINYAKSIINQIAFELQDEPGSTAKHVVDGWKTSNESLATKTGSGKAIGAGDRLVLVKATISTFTKGAIVGSTQANINDLTEESEKDDTDYDKQHAALNADKKMLKLAQMLVGIIDKGATMGSTPGNMLYNFRKEITGLNAEGDKKKVAVAMYMAAFLYESADEQYRLYDSETVCAGLGQTAIKALVEEAGIKESELRTTRHGVEVETEGSSKTNHRVHAEGHTFVAIDQGHIAYCVGLKDGKPVYEELQVTFNVSL